MVPPIGFDQLNMWFWWAITSAIISAATVTFNKHVMGKGLHSSVVALFSFAFITLVSLPFYSKETSQVDATFFMAVIFSAVVYALAKTVQLSIFKHNNLSDIYPLAAITPVTLYIMSVVFLSETLRPFAVWGILLIACAIYLINFNKNNKNILHPLISFFNSKHSKMYLGSIVLSNFSTVAEKVSLNHTFPQNIYHLAFWENLFLTIIIGSYVIKTNKNWLKEIKENIGNLLISSILSAVLFFVVVNGFKEGPVALVTSVKKIEVLIVLLISYFFFKEKLTKRVCVAATLMLFAVFLIKL